MFLTFPFLKLSCSTFVRKWTYCSVGEGLSSWLLTLTFLICNLTVRKFCLIIKIAALLLWGECVITHIEGMKEWKTGAWKAERLNSSLLFCPLFLSCTCFYFYHYFAYYCQIFILFLHLHASCSLQPFKYEKSVAFVCLFFFSPMEILGCQQVLLLCSNPPHNACDFCTRASIQL